VNQDWVGSHEGSKSGSFCSNVLNVGCHDHESPQATADGSAGMRSVFLREDDSAPVPAHQELAAEVVGGVQVRPVCEGSGSERILVTEWCTSRLCCGVGADLRQGQLSSRAAKKQGARCGVLGPRLHLAVLGGNLSDTARLAGPTFRRCPRETASWHEAEALRSKLHQLRHDKKCSTEPPNR
jgi:hypothetical protein